jgi:hypothetical protein
MSMSTSSDALVKINDFDRRTSTTSWVKVTKPAIVNGLKDRIDKPDHINTKVVNLCGPGAFFRCLAMDDPVMYVNAVISLWETGSAMLGTRKFTASDGLQKATPGLPKTDGLNKPAAPWCEVDWVPTASLRDDENINLNYDDADGGWSGLTMPNNMEKWFNQAGYGFVKNATNVFFSKGVDNIKEADKLRAAGYRVCLLINDDVLASATQNNKSVFPNHWVCLTDAVTITKSDDLETNVHSWGAIMPVPAVGTMKVDVFLKNYYGYVAAKPS